MKLRFPTISECINMVTLKSSQQRIALLSKLIDELREMDRLREKVIVAELSDRILRSGNPERGSRGMETAEIILRPRQDVIGID
jgi:two-component sensor histidine kinase